MVKTLMVVYTSDEIYDGGEEIPGETSNMEDMMV